MKFPTIDIAYRVESINIFFGETLIVWMRPGLHDDLTPKLGSTQQIELRVTPNGKIEIFSTTPVAVKDFSDWHLLPEQELK